MKEKPMLFEKIQKDSLTARKERNTEKGSLLTTVLAQAKTAAIDEGHRDSVSNELVLKVIRSFLKGVNENLSLVEQGKISVDKKESFENEKNILESYLPQQMSAAEIHAAVQKSGAANVGLAMKHLKEHHDGQYDGKLASEIAKELFK